MRTILATFAVALAIVFTGGTAHADGSVGGPGSSGPSGTPGSPGGWPPQIPEDPCPTFP